jgi:SpoVK/Ycf46/Vps4 family AAA+-type ATPase
MENPMIDVLREHVESLYPAIYLATFEEREADTIIKTVAADRRILEWDMARGFVDFDTKRAESSYQNLADALDSLLDMTLDNHFIVIKDAHLALHENPLAVARLKALTTKIVHDDSISATVFLVSSQTCIPRELEKFITLFELPLPDEKRIGHIVAEYAAHYDLDVSPGLVTELAAAFRGLSRHEIIQLLNRGYQRDGNVSADDIELVLAEKEQIIKKSGILEMLPTHENLEEIGGVKTLKSWLTQKAAILANLHEARDFGVEAPKGVMIVGMPGCGKSLTARATAALFKLPLLRLDVGSLMGKYVGESEGNLRRALRLADAVSPCVLWVDELEKAFVGMGGNGSGSEVASRLFGYFLTWMQEKTSPVFVLATANDISALPPELMRKGRFDEIFYVDFPNEVERAAIFEVHLKRRAKLSDAINCRELAAMTEGFSGADIEAVVKETIEKAFVASRASIDSRALINVIRETQPLSVVMKDKVEEYRKKFSQTKIKSAS